MTISLLAGVITFIWHPRLERLHTPILIFDAGGLGLFSVSGAQKALAFGANPLVAALLGMLTGIGGGVVRDVLVGEIPTVLRKDLRVSGACRSWSGRCRSATSSSTCGGDVCRGRVVLCGSSGGDPPGMGAAYGGWCQRIITRKKGEPDMSATRQVSSNAAPLDLDGLLADLEALYKDVHSHPELSMQETRTAALAADRLRAVGYEVTTGVGGTGVIGLLRNGEGPTVMLRADMDALPVLETTGLPYASKATVTDRDGKTVPVAHMCGHDMHVTWLAGAAKVLAEARTTWRGTLVTVFQPGEETAEGARAMIGDGLLDRVPKPDVILGQHVMVGPAGPWLDEQVSSRLPLTRCGFACLAAARTGRCRRRASIRS